MIRVTNEEGGILPFHEWKDQQYRKDQESGTPHTREWYYSAYGGYCEQMRRQAEQRRLSGS